MQKYSLFIGIDISKKWFDVCLSHDGNIKQMTHARFDNNDTGFKAMLRFIKKQAKTLKLSNNWIICLEHTGIYAFPLCAFLEKHNIDYVMDSALRIQRSLGLRRGKSDKADAADIARYIYLHHLEIKLSQLPSEELLKLKNLIALRGRLKKAEVSMKVAAKELKGFTQKSVNQLVSQSSEKTILQLTEQIKKVEQHMLQIIENEQQLAQLYKLLISIKGVGLLIATNFLVATRAFTLFQNSRQFACYIGIAPFPYESGQSIKKPDAVSNLANKKIKALISNGAQSAILHDKQIRAYFLRKIEQGKNEFLVRNNVKNKFVHRIFAVIKRGTPYVELFQHK